MELGWAARQWRVVAIEVNQERTENWGAIGRFVFAITLRE